MSERNFLARLAKGQNGLQVINNKEKNMKIDLELNVTEDGIFLNAWDSMHGDDICIRVNGGNSFDCDGKNITIDDFIRAVIDRENNLLSEDIVRNSRENEWD